MAEELDNTSPKAELIKQTPPKRETAAEEKLVERIDMPSGEKNVAPGQGKRRKIVVKTTKSSAAQGNVTAGVLPARGAAPASMGQNKRLQPKVVAVTTRDAGSAAGAVVGGVIPVKDANDKKRDIEAAVEEVKVVDRRTDRSQEGEEKDASVSENAPGAAASDGIVSNSGNGAIASSSNNASADGASGGQTQEKPAALKEVSTFQISQRPHVVAGRVSGRQVGPRSQDNRRNQAPRGEGFAGRSGRQGNYGGKPSEHSGAGVSGGVRGGRNNAGFSRQGKPGEQRGGAGNAENRAANLRPGGMRGGIQRPGTGLNVPAATPPVDGKGAVKRVFKAKKPLYIRKDKEEMEEKLRQTKKKIAHIAHPVPKVIEIMEVISVSELAKKMNLRAADLIAKLLSMGQMVTINQQIDADTATLLAAEYGADVKIVNLYDETVIESGADDEVDLEPRPPVVTVMGHVDHGKTKLLDAIRSADVVAGEFGGITQHIGAYTVETAKGDKITFLDTPGHEAFTRMRARGAQVTDIVVLVVAADDGVMPQTVEAITHAKEAGVPIIVAVNKIDKAEANPDRVKTQLSDYGLQPEEWGGQTMFVEISALKNQRIDKLIEAILLEAEILELKANYNRRAEGKVLESRIDPGRGTVATVLVERGTLKVGDSFVAGIWPGRVRALYNDKAHKVAAAGPSAPIEVTGFDEGIPNAGDPFQVVEDERFARDVSAKRQELKRFEDAKNVKKITLENLHDTISEGEIQELKVIIKSDVQGSAEALRSSLEKLSTKEVRLTVIQALPGAINEGDVELASASKAILIGFNVRPVPKAKALADQERVDIRKYNIIFKAVEEIQQAMEGLLKPELKEETLGTAEVRDTFKTPKFGAIAGCFVLTGVIKRNAKVHVVRDNIEIHTGKIGSLRRFKDDVKEVAAGFECGLGIEGFNDIQTSDQLEIFEIVEVARKLQQ
ncbi:MAG: translation initiation factor IF-2 [Treponema sp.]|jgi:translation initiation factor IF-2|nr:translation initiation factor IF-2 [Treponema sp.]